MQNFVDYLIEREIHHRSQKGGKAKDEESFAHFANYASEVLGPNLDLKSLLALVAQAKNDPSNALSFKRSPKGLFVENTKNEGSKQSYHDMLRMAAFSLAETAKHPEMKDIIKHGFKVEVAGREIYPVTKDWTRQGVPLSSITGTGKTDLRFVDNKTGKTAATASMKRGPGQGLSAQPGEAMGVLTYTANKTLKETLGDRSKHPEEYAEVFGILAEFNKLLRSTGNIKDKEKRDKAIDKVKPQLQKLFDNLQDRPYMGVKWRKAIVSEAMNGEGKFGAGSPGAPSFVLGFGEGDDAFFNTMKEYLKASDEEIMNTPIYFTLPKTREGKYPVFRTGTLKRKHKSAAVPEAKPERKEKPEPEPNHPLGRSNTVPGSPDMAFHADHELAPQKTRAVSSKKPAATGVVSKMKAAVKGTLKKITKTKQPAPAEAKRKDIPWEKIQGEYIKGKSSVDDIGKTYGVNPASIKWHAGTHGWRRGANI